MSSIIIFIVGMRSSSYHDDGHGTRSARCLESPRSIHRHKITTNGTTLDTLWTNGRTYFKKCVIETARLPTSYACHSTCFGSIKTSLGDMFGMSSEGITSCGEFRDCHYRCIDRFHSTSTSYGNVAYLDALLVAKFNVQWRRRCGRGNIDVCPKNHGRWTARNSSRSFRCVSPRSDSIHCLSCPTTTTRNFENCSFESHGQLFE
mmetsp:Transcript_6344/g.9081  ORF Transcript_6344/g.9081 Transcript_6344/m.9081 type:complete len:204 (+) Transcript_6344:499-1110(+)